MIPEAQQQATSELSDIIGRNQKRLRTRRGLSLERLAAVSGVSKSMLGQIEQGKSAPTINLLWKVAKALDVPFSALYTSSGDEDVTVIPADKTKILYSHDNLFSSRALFPFDGEGRKVEFYELELKPRGEEVASPHAAGTIENLVVSEGEVEITVEHKKYRLGKKDAINFKADVPHSYRNTSLNNKAVIYLVMIYAGKDN
jgi:transcriptional regulator with XRE-family HTH domain